MPAWLLPAAIGVGSALGNLTQSRANDRAADLSEAELEFLKQRYTEREPLRAMGLARLRGRRPERPNLGADFADPSNPFYRPPHAVGFGQGYTAQNPDLDTAMKDYGNTKRALGIEPRGGPPDVPENLSNYQRSILGIPKKKMDLPEGVSDWQRMILEG